jgi:hypothetical protein
MRRQWSSPALPQLMFPRTVTETERWLHAPDSVAGGGLLVIRAVDRSSYEGMADAFSAAAYSTVYSPLGQPVRVRGATAAVWESERDLVAQRGALGDFCRELEPAPVLALANFPRVEDRELALAAGAVALLGRPVDMADLLHEVAAAVRHGSS